MKAKYYLEEFASTTNDLDNRLPKSRGRCFDIGIWGGCGPRCPVFCEGECEIPEEMDIEYMRNEYDENEFLEIIELYDCFKNFKYKE